MRIVFLDVDGVLNCVSTKEKHNGFKGIDQRLVENLADFVRISEEEEATNIVITSSWRVGQNRNGIEIPDSYQYLAKRLKENGISIYDDTPRLKWGMRGRHRGREIAAWFYMNNDKEVNGYVVLDDELFPDYEKYKIIPHLILTSRLSDDGGFQRSQIDQALQIIRRVL